MSFARLHKLICYLIAGLGLASLSIGPELELPSEIAIFLGFGASWFVEGPILKDVRWARGWTIGLLVFLGVQVVRGFLGAPILPLVLEFAAALQISRLFSRRGAAEHQQIAALALLHLIAATVLSTELSYAFAFLGFVVVAPWMLALGHLRAEIEGQQAARPEAERDSATERLLRSKRLVGPGFLLRIGALAIPLFAMTGLVFLAFPRVGLGFLSFGRDIGQRVSGFGANVELGDFGLIRTDPTVVLRVKPPGLPENPPERASIRMRGTSFDNYDGRRWTRSRDLGAEGVGRMDSYFAIPYRMPDPSQDRRWEIVLDALEEPVIFLPPSTVGLEIPPRVTGGVEVGREISIAPGIDVRYADADGLGLRYAAWTSADSADRDVPLDPDMLRRYLQVPEGHERVAALAREWTRGATTDRQRALAILGHLRDSGEFEYSLEMPRLGDRLPLDVFLFEARRGHCEYYSTAMAVMLRTLGIPTRNVTGFLGGAYNSYGGYYSLSQGDAHSWLEAWLPNVGWVPLDPTPSGRDDVGIESGWLATLRDIADAVKTRWSEDVVGYDLRSQVALFGTIRRWLGNEGGGEERGPDPRGSDARGERSVPGWVWVALLALAALVVAGAVLWRRRRAKPARLDPAVEGAVRLYRGLDAALTKLGYPRPPDRTPVEHVAAIEGLGFSELDLVREVTRAYLSARYGAEPIPAPDLERLENAVRALRGRRDLSRAAP